MARLIYSTIQSLDGYIEDVDGHFDWSEPDEDVHQHFNDLLRPVGTFLYGRRMYETMAVWETEPALAAGPPVIADFAKIWQAADKIVYSTTLDRPVTARTRIERSFDPDAVRELKASADRDLEIGGAHLAAQALRAGLVDEVGLMLAPVVVGGGKQAIPDGVRLGLELVDLRRFPSGMAYLAYRVTDPDPARTPGSG
ncbi:MAG TPA: dihydrofolate reductase family protein [Acidimicrobiales bacterium]|nr:dihydrofolate reductase family protein [Acidimicrobiales bacterium]